MVFENARCVARSIVMVIFIANLSKSHLRVSVRDYVDHLGLWHACRELS